jgi:hypothetical protein
MSEVNTLIPYRGGFVRADRADDYQPTQVTARAANVSGTAIEQAHATMAHAKAQFEKHLDGIQRDRFSAEGLREQIANFADTDAARAVNTAVEQVQQRRDQAQTQADKVRRDLSPSGDTAAELRAARYWNRTKGVLDTLDSGQLLPTAQDLIAKADRTELGTLLQELPAYVQARGQTTEWLDPALAQVVPEFGRAREQLTKAEQALQITEHNANALRRGFTEGRPPTVLVEPGGYDPDR